MCHIQTLHGVISLSNVNKFKIYVWFRAASLGSFEQMLHARHPMAADTGPRLVALAAHSGRDDGCSRRAALTGRSAARWQLAARVSQIGKTFANYLAPPDNSA